MIKADFGMPVLANTGLLARCLRLREAGNRLILETAPNCSDSSFGQNARIRLNQLGQ